MAKKMLKRYLQRTTVHGMQYIAEEKSFVFRMAWACLVLLSFTTAVLLIIANLRDAADNPFVTSVDTVSVQDVPFPSLSLHLDYAGNPWCEFHKAF